MIFTTKPYDLDASLLADAGRSPSQDETPLEYHINHHDQHCSCGSTNCWSELTLVTFHRARKTKIVRAAAAVEYNIPVLIHNYPMVRSTICFFCAPFRSHDHLPSVAPAQERVVPLGWRDGPKPKSPAAKTKTIVTDDDLLA